MNVIFKLDLNKTIALLNKEKYSFEKQQDLVKELRKESKNNNFLFHPDNFDGVKMYTNMLKDFYSSHSIDFKFISVNESLNLKRISMHFNELIMFLYVSTSLNIIVIENKLTELACLRLSFKSDNDKYDMSICNLSLKLNKAIKDYIDNVNKPPVFIHDIDYLSLYPSNIGYIPDTSGSMASNKRYMEYQEKVTGKSKKELEKEEYERKFNSNDKILRVIKEFWKAYKNDLVFSERR